MLTGTVLRKEGGVYEVDTPDGTLEAKLPGRLKREERTGEKVVVGDRVDLEREQAADAVWSIVRVHDRSTILARRAPGKAPRSYPNNSASSNCSGNAGKVMFSRPPRRSSTRPPAMAAM